jgi:hypothetical protein
MVAGTGRFDTRVMQHLGERVFCKVGAEGVYCAALPEPRPGRGAEDGRRQHRPRRRGGAGRRNEYWQKVRRAPLATDRALTGRAMEWVARLPAEVRPLATCDRYARIVNTLAAAWNSAASRDECLEHLLNDRRRGRRGFPPDVERELVALGRHARHLPR